LKALSFAATAGISYSIDFRDVGTTLSANAYGRKFVYRVHKICAFSQLQCAIWHSNDKKYPVYSYIYKDISKLVNSTIMKTKSKQILSKSEQNEGEIQ
jgi:hypothetical protein